MNQKKTLDEKLKKFKERNSTKIKPNSDKVNFGVGFKISVDLIASIIVGVSLGLGFDYIFNTKPTFFLIFLILGIAAGFMNMYRTITKLEKK